MNFRLLPLLIPAICALPTICVSDPGAELTALGAKVRVEAGVPVGAVVSDLPADQYPLLARSTTLRSLNASGKTLNDATLPLLAPLTALEEFTSDRCDLTDEGFKHFAPLINLRSLSLFHPSRSNAGFTGAGLAHLQALPKLERLTFAGATAGDPALHAVTQLRQLRDFRAWHNLETAEGNAALATMTWLTHLKIGQRLPRSKDTAPSFGPATIPLIAQMTGLESLELTEAVFTAADLEPLVHLPNLKLLTIKLCAIPPEAIDQLRARLPQVEIRHTPLPPDEAEALLQKKLKLATTPTAPTQP